MDISFSPAPTSMGKKNDLEFGFKKHDDAVDVSRDPDSSSDSGNNSSSSSDSSDVDLSGGRRHGRRHKWKRCKVSRRFGGPTATSMDCVDQSTKNKAFADASQLLQSKQPAAQKLSAKKLNVWSNVLAEQGLVHDLNSVDVQSAGRAYNERDCESYDYTVKYRLNGSAADNDPHHVHRRLGLKRSSQDRASSGHLPLLDKNRRSFTLSEDDTDEKVVVGIAAILREPKKDLISRVVSTLGTKKSIELLSMTEDIEEAGGLMTLDNSRRRTPGGVFLQLVRTDRHISKTEKDVIFEVERAEYMKAKKQSIKKARRRRAQQSQAAQEEDLPTLPKLEDLIAEKNAEAANLETMESSDCEKEPGELDSDND